MNQNANAWTVKAAFGLVGVVVGGFGLGLLVTYAVAKRVMGTSGR